MNEYDTNYVYKPVYFLVGVKTVVFGPDGNILLIQRSDKLPRAHGWDLVGGGVDQGEDPTNAAIREILEEPGLSIYNVKPITTYISQNSDNKDIITIGFYAKTDDSNVTLGWENESYQWVPIEKAIDFNLPDLHRHIVEAAQKPI